MEIYWEHTKQGQKLILNFEDKHEMIGGIRKTKSGFDAFAKTFTMTPERARKGLTTIDEAKGFVESFRPWELFLGPTEIYVEKETRPSGQST